MSEESIVRSCAPTLAGMKTGNMFSTFFESRSGFIDDLRAYRASLKNKGIEFLPIRICDGRALMYMFRPDSLRRDISQPDNSEFLRQFGYDTEDPYKAVGALIRRFRYFPCPHEIGLFLGYPLEDVRGFIDYKGSCYKYAGLWKVYGDVENSKRIFKRYKQCTESFCRRLSAGASMDDLIA